MVLQAVHTTFFHKLSGKDRIGTVEGSGDCTIIGPHQIGAYSSGPEHTSPCQRPHMMKSMLLRSSTLEFLFFYLL